MTNGANLTRLNLMGRADWSNVTQITICDPSGVQTLVTNALSFQSLRHTPSSNLRENF